MTTAPDITTTPARPPLAGRRPLFASEDAAAYDSLLRRVSDVVKPADLLEEIWLQDVVELRNAMLREIADYGAVFAAHLARATADIEDTGFKVVASRPALPARGSA